MNKLFCGFRWEDADYLLAINHELLYHKKVIGGQQVNGNSYFGREFCFKTNLYTEFIFNLMETI